MFSWNYGTHFTAFEGFEKVLIALFDDCKKDCTSKETVNANPRLANVFQLCFDLSDDFGMLCEHTNSARSSQTVSPFNIFQCSS